MAEGANEDFQGFEFVEVLEAVVHGEAFLQELPSDIEVSDISSDEDEPPVEDVRMPAWSKEFTDIGMEPLAVNDVGPRHHLSYMSSVLKFFYLMVSELFFFTMVDATNSYARFKNPNDARWEEVTLEEMNAFVGLQIFMGIHSPGLGVPLFKNTIPRWRFEKLKQYFHISDRASELSRGHPNFDKLQKVRPILNLLSKTFCDFYVPGRYLSVDKAMCAFRGRISFLQYMPLKLIKRGIKVWMCSVPGLGYTSTFDVYTGKGASISGKGLSYDVVTKLVQPFYLTFRCVVFDNLFTGIGLLRELLRNGTYSVGTFRQNCKGFPVDLKNFRLKLKESEMRQCAQLIAAIWKDKGKSNVTTLSTGHQPFVGDVRQRTGVAVNVVNCRLCNIHTCRDCFAAYHADAAGVGEWYTLNVYVHMLWLLISLNFIELYWTLQFPCLSSPLYRGLELSSVFFCLLLSEKYSKFFRE